MIDSIRRTNVMAAVDKLCQDNLIGFDDFLEILSIEMKEQSEKEEHPGVKNCLLSVSESLRHASFDFYASTK